MGKEIFDNRTHTQKLFFILDSKDPTVQEALSAGDHHALEEILLSSFKQGVQDSSDYSSINVTMDEKWTAFGCDVAHIIVEAAKVWNDYVRKEFIRALHTYMGTWTDKQELTLPLNNLQTSTLSAAVNALNNEPDIVLGKWFIYNSELGSLSTVMTDSDLMYIEEHPELCIIASVECLPF